MNNKGELLFHEAGTRQSRLLFILSFFRWPNFKTKYYLKQIIFKWLKAPLKNPLPLKSFVFPFRRSAKLIYSKNNGKGKYTRYARPCIILFRKF